MTAWLEQRAALVLVGIAVVVALAFPTTGAGGVAMLIVVAAIGVGISAHLHRLPPAFREPPPGLAHMLAIGVVLVGAAAVFGRVLHDSIGWTMGDWGPQHAVLRDVVDGMRAGDIPTWNHAISTGDAPLETYPAMTYLVAGATAIATGMDDHLRELQLYFAIVVHTLIAVGITRLALRVAPAPIAALVGLTQLVDAGAISSGGVAGNITWALVHTALAQALFLAAVIAVIEAVARPRLRSSVAIWIWTALAAATHPSSLLAAAGVILALLVVALIARDVPARRPLIAAGHVAIGLALAAIVWMPLGERLMLYAQHFPSAPHAPAELLASLVSSPVPWSSFPALIYVGYVGMIAALVSRRAVPVLLAAAALALLLGRLDTTYLALDLGPSPALARLGAERFQALCRPFVVAMAAYALGLGWRLARARWRGVELPLRRVAAAALALGAFLFVRAFIPFAADQAATAAAEAERHADPRGELELEAWARTEMAALPPGQYARALFQLGDVHYNFHLTAETGMPSFHMGAIANLLLRERIEDTSPESLRRFAVRWVIVADEQTLGWQGQGTTESWEHAGPTQTAAALALGDPATERRFGRYIVREVPGWDGAYARIERGEGAVRVVSLANDRVELELTGTDQPALVALGTGFYPRWRAHDSAGGALPVYALPTIADGELHVVSAWVRPGRTVFTCDGALPSDGKGRPLALGAALGALAIIVVWSRRRWRVRVLRLLARGRRRLLAHRRRVLAGAGVALAVLLPIAGAWRACAPARTIEVGLGLRGIATVTARPPGGNWQECGYSRLTGRYTCPGIVAVADAVHGVVNDAQPNWELTTPAIALEPLTTASVEVRVELSARLAGTYWVGATGGAAVVTVADDLPLQVTTKRELLLPDRGSVPVRIEAIVGGLGTRVALVRRDAVDPARPFLVPPPASAPW